MNRTTVAAFAAVLISLAACSSTGGFPPTGSPGPTPTPGGGPPTPTPFVEAIMHPTGANDLVLREEVSGGLVPPGFILSELPVVSIYGDGRVITQGPQIEIYPGPALPNLRVQRVSEAGLQRILAAAAEAGLMGDDVMYLYPVIADAPTTTFWVNAGGAKHRTSAYALGIGDDPSVVSPEDAAARAKMQAFAEKLGDLAGWLGPDVVSADAPYTFEAIRIYSQEAEPTSPDQGLAPTVADWPLSTPLSSFGEPFRDGIEPSMRCGVVTGDDLATLRPALEAANQLTFWRSEGRTYQLILRPLLPDESGCPPQ